jgi:hypothetical protein
MGAGAFLVILAFFALSVMFATFPELIGSNESEA